MNLWTATTFRDCQSSTLSHLLPYLSPMQEKILILSQWRYAADHEGDISNMTREQSSFYYTPEGVARSRVTDLNGSYMTGAWWTNPTRVLAAGKGDSKETERALKDSAIASLPRPLARFLRKNLPAEANTQEAVQDLSVKFREWVMSRGLEFYDPDDTVSAERLANLYIALTDGIARGSSELYSELRDLRGLIPSKREFVGEFAAQVYTKRVFMGELASVDPLDEEIAGLMRHLLHQAVILGRRKVDDSDRRKRISARLVGALDALSEKFPPEVAAHSFSVLEEICMSVFYADGIKVQKDASGVEHDVICRNRLSEKNAQTLTQIFKTFARWLQAGSKEVQWLVEIVVESDAMWLELFCETYTTSQGELVISDEPLEDFDKEGTFFARNVYKRLIPLFPEGDWLSGQIQYLVDEAIGARAGSQAQEVIGQTLQELCRHFPSQMEQEALMLAPAVREQSIALKGGVAPTEDAIIQAALLAKRYSFVIKWVRPLNPMLINEAKKLISMMANEDFAQACFAAIALAELSVKFAEGSSAMRGNFMAAIKIMNTASSPREMIVASLFLVSASPFLTKGHPLIFEALSALRMATIEKGFGADLYNVYSAQLIAHLDRGELLDAEVVALGRVIQRTPMDEEACLAAEEAIFIIDEMYFGKR